MYICMCRYGEHVCVVHFDMYRYVYVYKWSTRLCMPCMYVYVCVVHMYV